jgi:hypothetical protein
MDDNPKAAYGGQEGMWPCAGAEELQWDFFTSSDPSDLDELNALLSSEPGDDQETTRASEQEIPAPPLPRFSHELITGNDGVTRPYLISYDITSGKPVYCYQRTKSLGSWPEAEGVRVPHHAFIFDAASRYVGEAVIKEQRRSRLGANGQSRALHELSIHELIRRAGASAAEEGCGCFPPLLEALGDDDTVVLVRGFTGGAALGDFMEARRKEATAKDFMERRQEQEGRGSSLPLWMSVRFFRATLRGLLRLQAMGLAHLGLDHDHVLITDEGRVLLLGLGHAVVVGTKAKARVPVPEEGSAACAAPEVVAAGRDGILLLPFKAVVYTAGLLLLYMITGERPLEGRGTRNEVRAQLYAGDVRGALLPVFRQRLKHKERHWESILGLLEGMLAPEPLRRATLEEVMDHPWVESFGVVGGEGEAPQ